MFNSLAPEATSEKTWIFLVAVTKALFRQKHSFKQNCPFCNSEMLVPAKPLSLDP